MRRNGRAARAGLRGALVAPPEQAARPEAQGQRRVGELVGALRAARVDSRAALAAAWAREPAWLRRELAAWVRPAPRAPALRRLLTAVRAHVRRLGDRLGWRGLRDGRDEICCSARAGARVQLAVTMA